MYTRVHVQFTSIDDTKKRSFLLQVLSNKENLFQLSAFSTGFSFFFGGGGGAWILWTFPFILSFVLHVCLCEMLMLVHYWKDICKFWDFISGKNLPNQETLQVDFHFVPDHFFFNYKTLKFYVLCIGREKILYFPARKVLRMLLLSCSLYIHSVTDIDMVITQHISSFVLTLEISVH